MGAPDGAAGAREERVVDSFIGLGFLGDVDGWHD